MLAFPYTNYHGELGVFVVEEGEVSDFLYNLVDKANETDHFKLSYPTSLDEGGYKTVEELKTNVDIQTLLDLVD